MLMHLSQRPHGGSSGMASTSGCHPATHDTCTALTHMSGRSPSLVAMERVVPKYASWDVPAARLHHVGDRQNVINQYLPSDVPVQNDCSVVASPCRNASVQPVCQFPAGSAAAGVRSLDNASVHSAKQELRAHLTHAPVSLSASSNISQVGKTASMMHL